MSNEREFTKLNLLAELQRLAFDGEDLAAILHGAVAPVMSGLKADRVLILPNGTGTAPSIATKAKARAEVQVTTFDIAAGGVAYGALQVEHAGPLSGNDRLFASTAAGLLSAAFIRLAAPPASTDKQAGLAKDRVPPKVELIHRVRNILSVVRIIVRRTAERAASVEDYAAQLEGRISALARVQTALITREGDSTDLATLIDDELVAHLLREDRVRARGPRVPLKAKAAETLGLTVHELLENALKFGALAAKDGHIDVTWWIEDAAKTPQLRLEWVETGVPVMTAAPKTKGFGHELIERVLPYELAAKTSVDFRPGGLRCELAIPLNDRLVPSDAAMAR